MNHKITALILQKRNRQRVNVYLDGEFALGLARIVAAWLQVGQEISDEKIAELKSADEKEVFYQQSLKFLNYRPRTESEVRQNLKKHKAPEETISYVMERLNRSGLVNDASFAEAWVENRSQLHPRSRRAISFELQQKGVDRQLIDQAVEKIDDEEQAYQAALKQSRKLKDLEWQTFRQKLYGFLARRGFNYEVSAPVVTRVWEEIHEDGPIDEDLPDW
jgi:regulatory protein